MHILINMNEADLDLQKKHSDSSSAEQTSVPQLFLAQLATEHMESAPGGGTGSISTDVLLESVSRFCVAQP
jgi:hypothetical protein